MGSIISGPDIDTSGVTAQLRQGRKAAKNLKPINLTAGGLSSTFDQETGALTIGSSAERQGLVTGLADQFRNQAGVLADLRARCGPGISALRAAQLADLESARSGSISNLRENLARRRVLGSSFGADAEARVDREFEQQRNKVIAETYLQELEATTQLIGAETQAAASAYTTELGELNLQTGLAQQLAAEASDVLTASAQLQVEIARQGASTLGSIATSQAELDAGAMSGFGSLLGSIALAPVTGGGSLAGNFLGGL